VNVLRISKQKRVIEIERINTQVKSTETLFKQIIKKLKTESYIIKEKHKERLIISKKFGIKKLFFSLTDKVEENILELEIFLYIIKIPKNVKKWLEGQTFGLKHTFWMFLFALFILFVPIIIIGYFDTQVLKNGFIIILSIIAFFGMFGILAKQVINKNQKKLKFDVEKAKEEIIRVLKECKEFKGKKIICWKCFKEIKKGQKKCPFCGTEL